VNELFEKNLQQTDSFLSSLPQSNAPPVAVLQIFYLIHDFAHKDSSDSNKLNKSNFVLLAAVAFNSCAAVFLSTSFLYQVFPGNTHQWQRLFYKAVRDGEFDVVKKMVLFFSTSHPDFITSREANSGNTVLHVGARFGHFVSIRFHRWP